MIDELVIASHNDGKAREVAELFAPHVRTIRFASELGLPVPNEDGATFMDNAAIKARAAALATRRWSVRRRLGARDRGARRRSRRPLGALGGASRLRERDATAARSVRPSRSQRADGVRVGARRS